MTPEEKCAAFDLFVSAFVNRWHDGSFSAHCSHMVDLPNHATVEECIPDLIAWAERTAKDRAKRRQTGTIDQGQSGASPASSCATSAASDAVV